ncbi:MAG: twin-arginine translocase TatA/TatE family subunit [Gammaproteobacteria bacterium]|jgi:sec-independent protein translocase protein TatA|nr:twin-arginine translocase TatA/TatE family subunit [Gammaproteobacteria bacterium]|tara:strand:+ start:580 stop:774 length:195 start_codon:yes stop_codon:yes gene_type:complete
MNFLRGIGPLEIFLILVIIMVIFGVGKLPEVGEGLGKGIRLFKNSLSGKDEEKDTKSVSKKREK